MPQVPRLRERRFLIAAWILLAAGLLWIAWPFLSWALGGLLLAYLLRRPYRWLVARLRFEALAAGLVIGASLLVVVLPLLLIGYSISAEVAMLFGQIRMKGLAPFLHSIVDRAVPSQSSGAITSALTAQIQAAIPSLLTQVVDGVLYSALGLFILLSCMYSSLVYARSMRAWVSDILPLSPARRESFMAEIGQAVEAVFYGIIVIAVVQGVLAGVLWWIGGLPNPLLWGTITFVFSMVPALGPTAVLYPGAIYAFVVGNYVGAAVLAIGGGASILVIDVYLRPWLIGNRGSLDPTLILVAIAGGVTVLGPFGLVAGPLALAVFLKISAFVIETHDVPPPGRSPAANGPSSRDHETDASSSGRARGEGGPVTPT